MSLTGLVNATDSLEVHSGGLLNVSGKLATGADIPSALQANAVNGLVLAAGENLVLDDSAALETTGAGSILQLQARDTVFIGTEGSVDAASGFVSTVTSAGSIQVQAGQDVDLSGALEAADGITITSGDGSQSMAKSGSPPNQVTDMLPPCFRRCSTNATSASSTRGVMVSPRCVS